MKINKLLTTYNLTKGNNREIKYLVLHYVGATGGAEANCKYFASEYVGASAHYFVGHSGEIWQCVEDKDISWHCGSSSGYKHTECRNANSIGIELCCRKDAKGQWYFEEATYLSAIELVRELMAKYNIPINNVIRHYDVTGKVCPEPFVSNEGKYTWSGFKADLTRAAKCDNTADSYATTAIDWAVANGILKGNGNGDYMLHSAITRQDMLVFLHRALNQE